MSVRRFNYSILQLIGITMALGAALALYIVLVSPPLGSTGLREARLPAAVLLVALWFCWRSFLPRMAGYAIVSGAIAIVFFLQWVGKTDLMFGHYHGPPPWLIAAFSAAVISIVANVAWWGGWVATKTRPAGSPQPESEPQSRWSRAKPAIGMFLLLVPTALIALVAAEDLPRARRELDYYVKQRTLREPHSTRAMAGLMARPDLPERDDVAIAIQSRPVTRQNVTAIPALAAQLRDPDLKVRRAAAIAIRKVAEESSSADKSGEFTNAHPEVVSQLAEALNDDEMLVRLNAAKAIRVAHFIDPKSYEALPKSLVPPLTSALARPNWEVRAAAGTVLGGMGSNAADAVPALVAALNKADADAQLTAIQVLGEIGPPAATVAVPQLAEILTTSTYPRRRSVAAQALGAMGEAARPALPSFKAAWEKRWLTIESAQAVYLIDAAQAEAMHIPRQQRILGPVPGSSKTSP
ncbi:MAG: HEAT repeat domain-containing protein [Burkholderiales bacterium]